jgi:hypothetical protein
MLHSVQQEDICDRAMIRLLSAVKTIGTFRQSEVIDHFDAIEVARDRLSELLDKAEGKS